MLVKCDGCEHFHTISPTAMAVIIRAFQDGDLQTVTKSGIEPKCLRDSFSEDRLSAIRKARGPKSVITFDNVHYLTKKAA